MPDNWNDDQYGDCLVEMLKPEFQTSLHHPKVPTDLKADAGRAMKAWLETVPLERRDEALADLTTRLAIWIIKRRR